MNIRQRSRRAPLETFLLERAPSLGQSGQLIFALNRDGSSPRVVVRTLERAGRAWRRCFPPFGAVIGKRGFAPPGGKEEGDGKTPTGIFRLGVAFGYEPSVPTRMPYRQVTKDDFWVDDAGSEDYNRWVRGRPEAASAERLRREDNLYKYGIVIEYNTNPVVKGKGSALFLHVWKARGMPTLGCLAMAEARIVGLLGWLDPQKKPLIVMGPESELF